MKKILITRPMPEPVIAALEGFALDCRASNAPLSAQELRQSLAEYDAVLPTLGDAYDAGVFADVPDPRAKLLANFGAGFNHIDIAAATAAGIKVTNTPGAVHVRGAMLTNGAQVQIGDSRYRVDVDLDVCTTRRRG